MRARSIFRRHASRWPLLLGALALLAAPAAAQSPWLPAKGRTLVTQSYVSQGYDHLWMGDVNVPFGGDVSQKTYVVSVERGIAPRLALDLSAGFTGTAAEGPDDQGFDDTRLGLRWSLLPAPEPDVPADAALALRLGAIIQGSYQTGFPASPGDGANGAEASLLFGKGFRSLPLTFYGDAGYRWRAEEVPADYFGSFGAIVDLGYWTHWSLGYRHSQGLDGVDIGTPEFAEEGFPCTREVIHAFETSFGLRDRRGRGYSLLVARTFDGRNTDEKTTTAVSFTLPF